MLHLIACPDPVCGAPAEVVEKFVASSTQGPVVHFKTYCVGRHAFLMPADRIVNPGQAAAWTDT
jgi:hypothetical protein